MNYEMSLVHVWLVESMFSYLTLSVICGELIPFGDLLHK